jgi:hypothetical protein
VWDGIDEVGNTFLTGDAADEEDVGFVRVDTVLEEGILVGGVLVLLEVDAVVDDVDAGGIDVGVGLEDVGFGAVGDGDDGVCVEDGSALHPGGEGVAGAELLSLPGAEGLKGVGGKDEGDSVEFFGQEASHGDVPGVGVDDVEAVEVEILEEV